MQAMRARATSAPCSSASACTRTRALLITSGATHSTVILGLVPRTQPSRREKRWDRSDAGQRGVKVDPVRAGALDQVDLQTRM